MLVQTPCAVRAARVPEVGYVWGMTDWLFDKDLENLRRQATRLGVLDAEELGREELEAVFTLMETEDYMGPRDEGGSPSRAVGRATER